MYGGAQPIHYSTFAIARTCLGIDMRSQTEMSSGGDAGDSRRRNNPKQRRKYGDRHGASGDVQIDDADDDIDLNIRVKEKDGNFVEPRNTMSKITLKAQSGLSHEKIKETIKRPLTGLFKRSSAKATKNEAKEEPERVSPAASSASIANVGNGAVTAGAKPSGKSVEKISAETERSYHSDSGKPLNSSVNVNRVQPDLYLDSIMMKYPQLSKLDDIDVSVLARYLCTEEESCDENVSWTWDYLFASVSSELREDWAFEEDIDDDPYDSAITFDQQRTRPPMGANVFSS
uniref:Intraflagellar transport protein 43 homolog n=1 Tax=Steinernema glaseri TaxID=37863 RepID=A0A1I7ZKP1_9BILA